MEGQGSSGFGQIGSEVGRKADKVQRGVGAADSAVALVRPDPRRDARGVRDAEHGDDAREALVAAIEVHVDAA